ncbi:MAG: hypothetical protein ACE15D_18950 [Candidatus Eisenbacteria bacterium]
MIANAALSAAGRIGLMLRNRSGRRCVFVTNDDTVRAVPAEEFDLVLRRVGPEAVVGVYDARVSVLDLEDDIAYVLQRRASACLA